MGDRLAETVAVVTGGARGIGEATCRRFAAAGADLAIVDRDGDAATAVARSIESDTGVRAIGIEADVGDEPAVEAMAEAVDSAFGHVDVLVNNAAIRVEPRPVTEADEESWDRIVAVNQTGVAVCAKHIVPLMADGGSIVNVASNGASVARPNWSQYDATKGAVVSMTKDMACDHAGEGIRVNAVSPGWVITDFHLPEDETTAREFFAEKTVPHPEGPGILKRAAEPREVADAILFLASEAASFVTGTNLAVDGGVSAVGNGLDWDAYEGSE